MTRPRAPTMQKGDSVIPVQGICHFSDCLLSFQHVVVGVCEG